MVISRSSIVHPSVTTCLYLAGNAVVNERRSTSDSVKARATTSHLAHGREVARRLPGQLARACGKLQPPEAPARQSGDGVAKGNLCGQHVEELIKVVMPRPGQLFQRSKSRFELPMDLELTAIDKGLGHAIFDLWATSAASPTPPKPPVELALTPRLDQQIVPPVEPGNSPGAWPAPAARAW